MAKSRKIVVVILAFIIILTLFYFLVLDNRKSDSNTVLRVSVRDQGSYFSDQLKGVFEAYEEQNTNIGIKLEVEPWEHYWTKLQTQIMGGMAPDIMIFSERSLHTFAENNALQDLDTMVEEDNYDLSDFYEVALETGRWNGRLYGLPIMMEVPALFYVKDAFDATDTPYPKPESMTWNDFLELCRKLTVFTSDGKVEQYGYVEQAFGSGLLSWITQNGGGVVEPIVKPERCVINSPEAIEAAQFYFDLSVKYHYTPTIIEYRTEAMGDSFQYLRSGKCALFQAPSTAIYFFEQNIKRYGVVPLPHNKKRSNSIKISFLCINSKSKHLKEAWGLLKHMVGPVQEIIAESLQSFPARKSIAKTKFLANDPAIRNVFLEELNYSIVPIITDRYMELIVVLGPYLDQMGTKKISVSEAMNEISEKMNAIIETE